MRYLVYIIYSASLDKYYIGFTGDGMDVRMRKHNGNHSGFTGNTPDWIVKYVEEFDSKTAAMKREKEIKGWKSRKKMQKLFSTE